MSRTIIAINFITLDGVLQGPGGPQEDTSGQFQLGGWTVPYFDDKAGEIMQQQMRQSDYLLGRKTFEIWENYWPQHNDSWPGINAGTKYIASTTRNDTDWQQTKFLKNVDEIIQLKETEGPDLQVWGSGNLLQTLFKHDLVDELWLKIFPVTLGQGKRLFDDGTIPAAFTLTNATITPAGVIIANYKRAGEVQTGNVE